MTLLEIEESDIIRQYLSHDRVGCAHLLGYLEPSHVGLVRWWGWFDDVTEEIDLLLAMVTAMSEPLICTVGNPAQVEPMLTALLPELPSHFYGITEHDHLPGLANLYDVDRLRLSLRMALKREDHDPALDDPHVMRLGPEHQMQMIQLFRDMPDTLFEPFMLDTGQCFGLFDQAGGSLVSASSALLVSRDDQAAILGPVATQPAFRRMKLAWRVLARQLHSLFEAVDLVAVNVPESNGAAQQVYLSHLFEPDRYYWEGRVRLKY